MTKEEIKNQISNFNKDIQMDALIDWVNELEKENAELKSKIKHLTKHLEPQEMTALFEQVEEEVKQEQRIKKLELLINKMNKLYIRFGEIPKNEKSKIGNGIIEDGYKCIGCEEGVSVWNAIKLSDGYHLVAPLHAKFCTHGDFTRSAFPDDWCGCDEDTKIFVVIGDEVGKGTDNEPLLKNIKIIEELPYDYFRMEI